MGDSAGEEFLCRFDFGHLPFAAAVAAELTGDFEPGASSFNREFPLHLRQACHDVKEEASDGVAVSMASVRLLNCTPCL